MTVAAVAAIAWLALATKKGASSLNTASKTSTARKAMRAATVFTGAAGLAVAFGPTAMAAAGHAPAQGHSARATGTTPANIQLTAADIVSAGCNTKTNEWLHIEYSSLVRSECKAFGFKGFMFMPGSAGFVVMTAECGGNNYGNIYSTVGGTIPFGPGKGFREINRAVSAVSIQRWAGNDTCPWPR
jgi:hypothetical protein